MKKDKKHILVERHKDRQSRKLTHGSVTRSGKNKNQKGLKPNSLFSFFRAFNPIMYSFSIASVLSEYYFSIERVLILHYRSSLAVFKVHSKYIKNRFIEYFGRLKGLIYKFAIFLGRRPP